MNNGIKRYRMLSNYWLFMAMCLLVLTTSCSDTVRETSLKRFMQMVKDGEVERVTIIDGQLVEVFLTPESLTRTKYQGLFGDKTQLEQGKPHLEVQIVSEKAFRNELAQLKATFPVTTN